MGKQLLIIIYICMHVACSVDGESNDIQRPEDQSFNYARNGEDQQTYMSPIGGPDRFKFYYIGLGKRSGKNLSNDPVDNPGDATINKLVSISQSPGSLFDAGEISKQNGPGLTNDRLNKTMFDRRMLSTGNTYDKRDPELFTEDLYPIQSGKQLFETYMDSALDQMQRWAEETSQNGEILDEISAVEMAKQFNNDTVNDEQPASEIKTQSLDLSIASPDIYKSSNPLDNDGDSIDKAESKDDPKEEPWWAADKLYKFKEPKSTKWSPRGMSQPHVNPALFFTGLGRK
ncbi:hypothetical protein DPMN_016952 [Dreissena polymorpha]|uniref:Uncharacterized protein n=1 Tax=Dreissena polymorpha TaxID=45954 RepID=A0A9D4NAL0_DREPO|nr:hypothetical protein DPMN_016952 [Dreissena polymorpha]